MPRSRRRPARSHGQERLHDSVLQRMERHDAEPPAGLQRPLGRHEPVLQLLQFRVHRDTERLEGPRRGMHLRPPPPAQRLLHELRQLQRPRERRLGAPPRDGPRDPPALPLLAVHPDDPGQLVLLGRVHQVRRRRPFDAHAHVQRPVGHEREAPLRLVELHGGNPQVEGDAIRRPRPKDRVHLRKSRFHEPEAVTRKSRGEATNRRVAIERHDLRTRRQEGPGVTPRAESPVHDRVARTERQRLDNLIQQNRRVGNAVSHARLPRSTPEAPSVAGRRPTPTRTDPLGANRCEG